MNDATALKFRVEELQDTRFVLQNEIVRAKALLEKIPTWMVRSITGTRCRIVRMTHKLASVQRELDALLREMA